MDLMLKKCEISALDAVKALRSAGLLIAKCEKPLSSSKSAISTDSRKVVRGSIFIAIKGSHHDGHDHLDLLSGCGLSLIVSEQAPPSDANWPKNTPWIQVKDSRKAWSFLASESFNSPQTQLRLVAVTGTNGKTSTVWMVAELLRSVGIRCMTIGTLGAYLEDQRLPTGHTTPDPDILFGLLNFAVEQGVSVVAMEASSHALAQEKLAPLTFDAMAFTSFSRDHLDYHHTLEEYWNCKWRLFSELGKPQALCLFSTTLGKVPTLPKLANPNSGIYGDSAQVSKDSNLPSADWRRYTYQIESSNFCGSNVSLMADATEIESGFVPYFAKHAIDNFAAAFLIASHVSSAYLISSKNWNTLRPVPGRLEQILVPGQPPVIVDYAHTPDALEKTLLVLRPLVKGRLYVVFGCGGNRDKGKRPLMGEIADRLADYVIVTSDNPRREDPDKIIEDICAGMKGRAIVNIEVNRELAIRKSVVSASANDLILIAGKGHETEQIFSDKTVPFDDRLMARKALLARRN